MQLDETDDWAWCEQLYPAVVAYVTTQQIQHGEICDWPEWDCAPYLSLWAVEDPDDPGFVGHWILAGDSSGTQPQPVPFDHLPATDLAEPREALQAFAKKWAALAAGAVKGQDWQGSPVVPGDLADRARQLKRQAELLQQLAEDDELWQDDD
ncbi:DUF4826 family protein [Rheinheimera sp.]|uniref:DUF4826 family protein n=1 Tax=Rheinheimera sp. TaxID=1869214 RepID=UPI00307DE0EF